jgi:hypothetical protein
MDDDTELAECWMLDDGLDKDTKIFGFKQADSEKESTRYRAPSQKMALDGFYRWIEGKLVNMNEDLFADSRKARQAKSNAGKPVYTRRLNKDGSESGMRDGTTLHNTEEEAKKHHDQLVANNPKQKIAHHMYSYNGEETFKTKFVAGKVVPLKGGIAGGSEEDRLEDATHDFIQMLDDEGSAAGTWMPFPKKVELYKLYRDKHKIKSTGVDTENMVAAMAGAKINKKIDSLVLKGWKLFGKKENSDYVDMVFTKAP